MELNEIITSGILEAQYLGLNSREDQRKVIEFAENSTDLSEYMEQLGEKIENHFQTLAVPPPPATRQAVVLRTSRSEIIKAQVSDQNAETGRSRPHYLDIEVNDEHIKVHKYWRPAFIAVFILSKIFLILALYFYFKSASLEKQLEQQNPSVESVGQ